MIPILYDSTETDFTSNGLGRLSEATSCIVTEARNGEYEMELKYPITGRLYDQINEGMIVSCTHDDKGDRQPFVIYRRSAPMNGIVVFSGHHKSYELNDIILDPIEATSAADAFAQMEQSTTPANPYTMWTDVITGGTFKTEVPKSVRAALGGTRGSVLDVFGGEYEWDGMTVYLKAHRGVNSGVTIRYGKNLTDLTQTYDALGTYDAVVPYWYQEEDGLVVLPEKYVARQGVTNPKIAVLDLTQDFEEKPKPADLRTRATSWLTNNRPWVPNENIKIKFIQLWQTEEYKDVAALQRLHLCDRVNVYYPALGIEVDDVEIIKVVYNVLLDRYDEMELGDARSTFAETIIAPVQEAIETATQDMATRSYTKQAVDHATQLITGGMGGNVVSRYDADGYPIEILIMDTKDVDTAQHVLRININGIGFSSTGINGPYTSAWTLDGQFVANFITAGTMSANRVRGGTFELGGANNGNGVLIVKDANGNEIGRWDNTGADISGDLTLVGENVDAKISKVDVFLFTVQYSSNYIQQRQADAFRIDGDSWGSSSDIKQLRDISDAYSFVGTDLTQTFKKTDRTAIEQLFNMQSDRTLITRSTDDYGFWMEFTSPGEYVMNGMTFASAADIDDGTKHYYTPSQKLAFFMLDDCFGICTGGLSENQGAGSSNYIGTPYNLGTSANKSYFYISPDWGGIHAECSNGSYLYVKGALQLREGSRLWVTGNFWVYFGGDLETSDSFIRFGSRNGSWKYVEIQSTSSRRYKHDIDLLTDSDLDPHKLLDLPVRQFVYNDDAVLQYEDMADQTLPGFIAEEVEEHYPAAVIHKDGEIKSWDERRIVPGMLALIQEQQKTIDSLQARVEKLEELVNRLIGD